MEKDRTDEIKMFKFKTQRIDNLRHENLLDVFPELEGIW